MGSARNGVDVAIALAMSKKVDYVTGHHLRGVHGGMVRCVGKAPSDLRFELGVREGVRPLLGFGPGERRLAARA